MLLVACVALAASAGRAQDSSGAQLAPEEGDSVLLFKVHTRRHHALNDDRPTSGMLEMAARARAVTSNQDSSSTGTTFVPFSHTTTLLEIWQNAAGDFTLGEYDAVPNANGHYRSIRRYRAAHDDPEVKKVTALTSLHPYAYLMPELDEVIRIGNHVLEHSVAADGTVTMSSPQWLWKVQRNAEDDTTTAVRQYDVTTGEMVRETTYEDWITRAGRAMPRIVRTRTYLPTGELMTARDYVLLGETPGTRLTEE